MTLSRCRDRFHDNRSTRMPVYKDFICPGTADQKWISRTLGSLKDEGEYRLYPVSLATFDAWASSHRDYKHPLQFSNDVLLVVIMYPPHDRAAFAIVQEIYYQATQICQPARCGLWMGTGLTRMRNGIRTNADMGLYNHSSGSATLYPGIVVECGFSDSLKKSRRDITLWLNNSDLEVKLGIVCKVGVDIQRNINLLIFEFWEFDYTHCTRTARMGRPKITEHFDFSNYDGTPQTLPASTVKSIPSFYLYSDGVYPAGYPPHPTPPSQIPLATNVGRQYPLRPNEIALVNRHITLQNNQRSPLDIDFRVIADAIKQIQWNA